MGNRADNRKILNESMVTDRRGSNRTGRPAADRIVEGEGPALLAFQVFPITFRRRPWPATGGLDFAQREDTRAGYAMTLPRGTRSGTARNR